MHLEWLIKIICTRHNVVSYFFKYDLAISIDSCNKHKQALNKALKVNVLDSSYKTITVNRLNLNI